MAEENQINIKDIVTARFSNPKFVYDGKRMRNLQTRKCVDYSSAFIQQALGLYLEPIQTTPKSSNLSSQILNLKSPEQCYNDLSCALTTKMEHVSINKIRNIVNIVRWTPDGRRLMSGTSSGEFSLWNGFGYNFETILQAHESSVLSMQWSPSGSFLISSDAIGTIKYWHLSMNNIQIIKSNGEVIRDLSFAPTDAKFLSTGDDAVIRIWDSKEAKQECIMKGHNWDIRAAKWHRSQSLIASASKDNTVRLWDPRVGEELATLHIHKNMVNCLKWSNDCNYLFTGGKDQVIKMLDIRNMKEAFTYKCNVEVTALAMHPHIDDLFVNGDGQGNVTFWQMYNDEPLDSVEKAHDSSIWTMQFHPVGHVLATGSTDHSVKFFIRNRPDDENTNIEEELDMQYKEFKIPGL